MQIVCKFTIFGHTVNEMEKEVHISFYLDTRRVKSNDLYPVKLRVFTPSPRKQMFYRTKFEFTKKDFNSVWETARPREEHKENQRAMQALEDLANEIANKITPFDFEQFEKKLLRGKGEGSNVFYQYEQMIKKLEANNQIGNASNYGNSEKSLKHFLLYRKGKTYDDKKVLEDAIANIKSLPFREITSNWLEKYETYMLTIKKHSRTTVSIYLRALRAIFNTAIAEKEIDKDVYPFGKRKYQVASVTKVKKALNKADLKKLIEAIPKTDEQAKARDFWFFSFVCNGMNIKDISLLRYEDIQGDKIIFYRAKTINTAKTDLRPVVVQLTKYSTNIIKKYGNPNSSPKQLLFPILNDTDSEVLKRQKIQNFTRFINQAIKKLAKANGINEGISTNWARHTFATISIRMGQSMEFVSEALNHSNMKTTQGYFAGFEDDDKKNFMESLMDFSKVEIIKHPKFEGKSILMN